MLHATLRWFFLSVDQSWFVKPKGTRNRTSAGGIVVRSENGRWLVALVRGEGDGEGYVLPKGGVDKGETLEQAARREIWEEAGFPQLSYIRSLGKKSRLSFDRRRWITTYYYLYTTTQTNPVPTDPHVAYVTEWFPVAGPLPKLFWPEQHELLIDTIPAIEAIPHPASQNA
jgi:8-oxo-dGTP pyrophosphatase MutT (NUDIX family)